MGQNNDACILLVLFKFPDKIYTVDSKQEF